MIKNYFIAIVPSLLISVMAFAHGEDELGPHGGLIRMPGAFHTEVLGVSSQQIKVFLLDMEWANPSTKGASLKIVHKSKLETPGNCIVENDHFLCDFPNGINLKKKGKLMILAERLLQKGNEVSYSLPLALASKSKH